MIYIAALILGVLFVWVIIVAGIMGATADAREAEKRLNAASLDLDSCFYIAADNGKDSVVNRHLQRRAEHLEKHAAKMREREKGRLTK